MPPLAVRKQSCGNKILISELQGYHLYIKREKLQTGEIRDGFVFLGYNINPFGVTVLEEKVADINRRLRLETSKRRKKQIAMGFSAYYRTPKHLPKSPESEKFLKKYGYELNRVSPENPAKNRNIFNRAWLKQALSRYLINWAEELCEVSEL